MLVITASFVTAAMVVLAVWGIMQYRDSVRYRRQLRYSCEQSLYELSLHLEEMNLAFRKSAYSSTPEGFGTLAARIYESGGYAKACITQMPTGSINLDNTYRYLSQSSEYMELLGKNVASGYELTEKDRTNMKNLAETASLLSARVSEIRDGMNDGGTWESDSHEILYGDGGEDTDFYGYMTEIDELLSSHESLIYEGNYSENIINPAAAMLENADEVDEDEARRQAAELLDCDKSDLTRVADENGVISSYAFTAESGTVYVTVTKKGGFPVYFIKDTAFPEENVISADAASQKALAFLSKNGLGDMAEIERTTADGICTLTFAKSGRVLVYSDTAKVSVSLDDGEIIGFDARQYIMNHKTREFDEPKYTGEAAAKVLSDSLRLKNLRLTTVPTVALAEKVCWEMTCTAEDGSTVIVYLGADDLSEKLILLKDEFGTK